jgi:hypothetical protein
MAPMSERSVGVHERLCTVEALWPAYTTGPTLCTAAAEGGGGMLSLPVDPHVSYPVLPVLRLHTSC